MKFAQYLYRDQQIVFTANCAGLEYYVTFQPPEAMSRFIMTTAMNKSEKYTIESFSAILDNGIDCGIKNQAPCFIIRIHGVSVQGKCESVLQGSVPRLPHLWQKA